MKNWSINDALNTYNVPFWSDGYFSINTSGHVVARPDKKRPQQEIDLNELTEELIDGGVQLPVLIRFPQILNQRVNALCRAFNEAIAEYEYGNEYVAVYPVKVNQQRRVIEGLLESKSCAKHKQLGLEAGSKPELMAVLALAGKGRSMIVCNGYKDREYVRLALMGEKLGHSVYIVLEKLSELELVLAESRKLNVQPRLGLRAKLAYKSKGKWETSGGAKSKFGLSATQVLKVVERLRSVDALDCLQLLHFHLGSQIANIRDIRNSVQECARFYAELRKQGAAIDTLDVGGGLGVDYEGTRSQSHCSANYSMREYANNIVYTIGDVCEQLELPTPRLLSESGRAMTAHHAIVITDVIGIESSQPEMPPAPADDAPLLLHNMWQTLEDVCGDADSRAIVEIFHDTVSDLNDVQTQYTLGLVDLEHRAWAEQVNQRVSFEVAKRLSPKNRAHRPLIDELNEKLADKFYVNFSMFQSLPDAWAIDQIFPVLPIRGLDQPPTRRAVFLDITCDSDGMIDQYVDGQGVETTLPVPAYEPDKPYPVGFFMVGAYQEILGDMHNLFGDTDSVDVWLNDAGQTAWNNHLKGDTVSDVLRYVNLDTQVFRQAYQQMLTNSPLSIDEQAQFRDELEQGLDGYTYLEDLVYE